MQQHAPPLLLRPQRCVCCYEAACAMPTDEERQPCQLLTQCTVQSFLNEVLKIIHLRRQALPSELLCNKFWVVLVAGCLADHADLTHAPHG